MDAQLESIFSRLRETADFLETDFSDVNASATDGDNGLHCGVRWGDVASAKARIEVNKAGDLGYTPLHVACMQGNAEIVKLLVEHGADLFALSEGDPPFTTARLHGQDHICDLLGTLMRQEQEADPMIWIRARIAQLRREIDRLEQQLCR